MNGAGFFEVMLVMLYAFIMGGLVVAMANRSSGNVPCGPSIRTRPPRDRESLLKLAKEKEEEMKDDGHEKR